MTGLILALVDEEVRRLEKKVESLEEVQQTVIDGAMEKLSQWNLHLQSREAEARELLELTEDDDWWCEPGLVWVKRRDAWLAGAAPAKTDIEKERDLLRLAGDIKTEEWEKAQSRYERAEAEVRRLREALEDAIRCIKGEWGDDSAQDLESALRGGEK